MKGQSVDEETDSARPFEGKGEFHLLQMKTPIVDILMCRLLRLLLSTYVHIGLIFFKPKMLSWGFFMSKLTPEC